MERMNRERMNRPMSSFGAVSGIAKSGSGSDGMTLTVERFDNHVYFYSEVNPDRVLSLMKTIRATDEDLRVERDSRSLPKDFPLVPIYLHINSGGGDLFAGLSAADQITQIETPIHSIIEGYAASAATLISVACSKRYITPSSMMMIHQLWSMHWGTHESFEDEVESQNMSMESIIDIYVKHSKLKRDKIEKMLKRDSWMKADTAIKNGFVDEIFSKR